MVFPRSPSEHKIGRWFLYKDQLELRDRAAASVNVWRTEEDKSNSQLGHPTDTNKDGGGASPPSLGTRSEPKYLGSKIYSDGGRSHLPPPSCESALTCSLRAGLQDMMDTLWLIHIKCAISATLTVSAAALQVGTDMRGGGEKNRSMIKLGLSKLFSTQMSHIHSVVGLANTERVVIGFLFIRNSPNYLKHRLSKVLEMFPQDLSADSKAISSRSTFFFFAALMLQTFPCTSENHIVA